MALYCRVFQSLHKARSPIQQLLRQNIVARDNGITPLAAISTSGVKHETALGHDERNMKLGRPMSPHLTIYAPQLTSMLSITHRATGMALTGYITILGLGAITASCPFSYYVDVVNAAHLPMMVVAIGKFILAFPFTYHTVNGIRHLFWDMGKYLTIKEVYTTGYASLGVSAFVALALACPYMF